MRVPLLSLSQPEPELESPKVELPELELLDISAATFVDIAMKATAKTLTRKELIEALYDVAITDPAEQHYC
jgi:hypothetical protein